MTLLNYRMPIFTGKPCRTCGGTERYSSGQKPCVACAKRNSLERRENGKYKKYLQENKEKVNAYNMLQYKRLKPEVKEARLRRQWLATYGLTLETFDAILVEQNGVCKICGCPQDSRRSPHLFVDHDHETGEIRGLLCNGCNSGLGYFGDSIDRLEEAVLYLKASRR